MRKLDKIEVTLKGLVPALSGLIAEWKPPKLKNEVAYRNHLLESLRESLPIDVQLEKEYRHRGTTIDIWIGWKGVLFADEVAMELKVNLSKKGEFDRLVGQIEGLDPKNNKTIVILIGDTEPSLFKRLEDKYKDQTDDLTETMSIIQIKQSAT